MRGGDPSSFRIFLSFFFAAHAGADKLHGYVGSTLWTGTPPLMRDRTKRREWSARGRGKEGTMEREKKAKAKKRAPLNSLTLPHAPLLQQPALGVIKRKPTSS